MPKVFSGHYFEHGLRVDPQYGTLVVYIPSIDHNWVIQNILPPFQSAYVLRLLNSLLYLRLTSTYTRQLHFAAHEQATMFERVSSIEISNQNHQSHQEQQQRLQLQQQQQQLSHLHQYSEQEIQRQKKVQCLIHGNETNIDEDMWRLFDLYHDLHDYELSLAQDRAGKGQQPIQSPFPRKKPKFQLMLKNDTQYLCLKPGVRPFDRYDDVPAGEKAPPSPILSALPQPRAAQSQDASKAMRSVEEACLQWVARISKEEQQKSKPEESDDSLFMKGTELNPGYSFVDLPHIERLSIHD